LEVLGGILFTEYCLSILLISILLFLSRVASLALTLSVTSSIVANNVNKVFLEKNILLTKRQEVEAQINKLTDKLNSLVFNKLTDNTNDLSFYKDKCLVPHL